MTLPESRVVTRRAATTTTDLVPLSTTRMATVSPKLAMVT
uniref:Uncharacterized protein n=1 Tax=Arundo donax TaxID=35708 RepID=A0A0A9FAE3_ARUDO